MPHAPQVQVLHTHTHTHSHTYTLTHIHTCVRMNTHTQVLVLGCLRDRLGGGPSFERLLMQRDGSKNTALHWACRWVGWGWAGLWGRPWSGC